MPAIKRLFRSLISRMLLLTILSVVAAQSIGTFFWVTQFSESEQKSVLLNAQHLAEGALSTITFFNDLPLKYRHLALEQLRGMGGTRFFVSLNSEKININPIKDSALKQQVLDTVGQVLRAGIDPKNSIEIEFSSPQDLHVLKNDILLKDLPPSWGAYSLTIPTAEPPILVLQIEMGRDEWLYLAAILPPPYLLSDQPLISAQQMVTLILSTLLLLLFIYLLFHQQTRPLQSLANAVSEMSIDLEQAPLKERGASEIVAATRAFNRMQQKLQRYIQDRELLFRSISHDLKTPITRLRLRAELLDDEQQTDRFNQDLEDLEMLVKGALQSVKDTDIHENIQSLNMHKLLRQIAEPRGEQVQVSLSPVLPFRGKPLALKRCLSNLIENGVKYGQRVSVRMFDNDEALCIIIQDDGPGIPVAELENIFQPYKRLHQDSDGHGLGLGIARNIIHAHNGDLHLVNAAQGGLEVLISLPRIYKN